MNQILNNGQYVRTETSPCLVKKLLGSGTQGEVYEGELNGNTVALKWYFRSFATLEQKDALDKLIQIGPPNDKFLWPMLIAFSDDVRGFGYIMRLRESRYKSIVDLMKRRIEPSFRALVKACLELPHSFLQLHAKGLCYADISFGNVFFDPDNGDVLICDNDNVGIDGASYAGVRGTPKFMAPEIVLGKANPSTLTDQYSLSVLLFYMLMIHHPLEGKKESSIHCMDLFAMNKLYGSDALFIFDPDNNSNEPDPRFHMNAIEYWSVYPIFIRDLFTRAFTKGIRDPDARVKESEWRQAMARLLDTIIYCGNCGTENFYDSELLSKTGNPGTCWSCEKVLRLPPRIRIGNNVVMLNNDSRLFPHHLDNDKLYDFSKPVAEVVQNPKDKRWGLKNASDSKWIITLKDNSIREIQPGHAFALAVGVKVSFGKVEGEIRV